MMSSKLKWLIVMQLLLNELALCRVPLPLVQRKILLPRIHSHEKAEGAKKETHSLLGPDALPALTPTEPGSPDSQREERVRSAVRVTSMLGTKLQGKIKDHPQIQGNVSCEELLSASTVDDPLSSELPQELLGLTLVPVLVLAGCPKEAQTLVLKLFDLLGETDTEELLTEVEALIARRMRQSASTTASPSLASPSEKEELSHHMDAVMFNIEQLTLLGEGSSVQEGHCEGWTRVNGTMLVGRAVEGTMGHLGEAVSSCESLGLLCAGVTSSGALAPGMYQAVLKKGSRIFPSASSESECWIRQCGSQDQALSPTAPGQRMKRSPQRNCINKNEERVYNVVEWIPGVSTLYNLGTAVYYASVNCSATAKERAILSAVDLGTDALMVATGGTAGVAGYALGAGMKTGVKAGVRYLLNSMKQEDDVLVNQISWEEGVITIQ
ncbi:uncharacterized protein apof [Menidia menidia]